MGNPLEPLLGQRVTEAQAVQDYAQILFGGSVALTIMNDYAVSGAEGLTAIKGLALTHVLQDSEKVLLTFEDGTAINVNLQEHAYYGPEAMVLHQEGQPTVVWN
jgi:hypothetical protein